MSPSGHQVAVEHGGDGEIYQDADYVVGRGDKGAGAYGGIHTQFFENGRSQGAHQRGRAYGADHGQTHHKSQHTVMMPEIGHQPHHETARRAHDQGNPFYTTLLNLKLGHDCIAGAGGTDRLIALVGAYFQLGGQHIQFNVVDTTVLRDAQDHPENYPDLLVRVAGFSVLFTAIDKVLQDDVIARTEHSL